MSQKNRSQRYRNSHGGYRGSGHQPKKRQSIPQRSVRSNRKRGVGAGIAGTRTEFKNDGIVENFIPDTETLEGNFAYARRMGRRRFTPGISGRSRIRRIVLIIVVVALALAAAIFAGSRALYASIDGRIGLGDSEASSALVVPADNEPYYVLFSADLDESTLTNLGDGPDALVLARVDEGNQSVSLISIPANLKVTLSDNKTHQLRDAGTWSDAALIQAVANFTGLDIAHYVRTDAEGIKTLTDGLGGVDVDITQEVDDPNAGTSYIATGTQTLDGEQALTFLRASNFTNGTEDQAYNQMTYLASVALHVIDSGSSWGITQSIDQLGASFKTDCSSSDAVKHAEALQGVLISNMYMARVPGYEGSGSDEGYYVSSADEWATMLENFQNGEQTNTDIVDTSGVNPSDFTIEIQNGTTVDGQAAQAEEELKNAGYQIEETGNADEQVYTETLIVYDGDEHKAQAQAVQQTLGVGRVVEGSGYYDYSTDILVVLGTDWKPLS